MERTKVLGSVVASSVTYVDNKVTVEFPLPSRKLALVQAQIPIVMTVDGSTVFSSVFAECSTQTANPLFNFNLKMVVSPSGVFSSGTAQVTCIWKGWFLVLPTGYIQFQVSPGSQYSSLPSGSNCILFFEELP